MKRRVVVTGLGAVTSLGCRVEELWSRIVKGESGVGMIQRFDASQFRSRIAGEIVDFSTDGYIEPKEVKKFDRFVQYAFVSGVDAVQATPAWISPRKTAAAAP